MAIAQDAQGEDIVTPWLNEAGVKFPVLLDRRNEIGKLLSVKYVPVGILLDSDGRFVRNVGMVDIRDDRFRSELEHWVRRQEVPEAWAASGCVDISDSTEVTREEHLADEAFQRAVEHLHLGRRDDAIREMNVAVIHDPENWLIRKQLWAIEAPGAFYSVDVDYDWQKDRLRQQDKR